MLSIPPDLMDCARPLLAEWAELPPSGPIDRVLVHKHQPQNVALSRFAELDDHRFVAQLHVEHGHPFFFEHPVDHVPGMLLVEAARQFGLAVAHQHYNVPLDTVFSLSGFDGGFDRFAELDRPTYILGETSDRLQRRDTLRGMTFLGVFVQDGGVLDRMGGTWRMTPAAVWARIRRGRGPK